MLTNARWYQIVIPGDTLLTLAGVTLLVFIFYGWSAAHWLGDQGPAQWLGKRSFSLYLIHEPVIVSVAAATRSANPSIVLAVAVPVSLIAAAVFYRVVELPAHKLSKAVGFRSTFSRRTQS